MLLPLHAQNVKLARAFATRPSPLLIPSFLNMAEGGSEVVLLNSSMVLQCPQYIETGLLLKISASVGVSKSWAGPGAGSLGWTWVPVASRVACKRLASREASLLSSMEPPCSSGHYTWPSLGGSMHAPLMVCMHACQEGFGWLRTTHRARTSPLPADAGPCGG